MDGLNAARVAAIRDSGPPVMAEASAFEADSPPRAFSPVAAKQAPATNTRLYREVFGFAFASSLGDPDIGYPSWNFGLLSTVAYFGLHVMWNGEFSNDRAWQIWNDPSGPVPGLVNVAHAHRTKVVVTIIVMDSTNGTRTMCNALQNGRVTIRNTVAQMQAKGIDGVNIDYESNNTSCLMDQNTGARQPSQSLFTAFVAGMRAALPSGAYLSVDTYSGSAGYRSGSTFYGFYDIGALAPTVDSFFVMAYDMEYANFDSPPVSCASFCLSPTAPLTAYLFNDSRASSEYTAVVPPSKVIMGIPYYGRKACVPGYTPASAPPSAAATNVGADGYLDASTENGYYANTDYRSHREGQDIAGATRWDTFTSSTAACTRQLYWDDPVALGNKYNLVIRDQLRGIGIFALNYGGGAPELWSLINLKFGQCSEAAIAPDRGSPQIPSTIVSFGASALCAGTGTFRFSMQRPGGAMTVVQDYSPQSSWSWDTSSLPLGTYTVQVDARNLGASARLDTSARTTFRLARCVTPSLTVDQASPQLVGTTVALAARATCEAAPEYQYSMQDPGGRWSIVQPYGPSPVLNWDTTRAPFGDYRFMVSARSSGTDVQAESTQTLAYSLTSCVGTTLTTDSDSPQPTGSVITLEGAARCLGGPQYRFVVESPNGSRSIAQDFGAASSFRWTAGGPAGVYVLEVDARMAGAPSTTMSSARVAFGLSACAGATLAAPETPVAAGGSVTLVAAATCGGLPEFRFWMSKDGTRTVIGDWLGANQLTWSTAGLSDGRYTVGVDVRDIGSSAPAGETSASRQLIVETPRLHEY